MRPLIGISTSRRTGWRVYPFIALGVWLAGGRSRRWQAGKRAKVTNVDGIIVGGGDDISPELYGGELVATAVLDPDRDALAKGIFKPSLNTKVSVPDHSLK